MLRIRPGARKRVVGFLAAVLALCGTRGAWASFTLHKFGGADAPTDIAMFDCNDDGRLDVVTVDPNTGGKATVFRNDGGALPTMTSVSGLPDTALYTGVAPGDFDNDGIMDLVFVYTTKVQVWNGSGACAFTLGFSATPANLTGTTVRVSVADLNNDGYQDIMFGDSTNQAHFMLNKKDGTFRADTTLHTAASHALKPADLNMDGRMDVVLGLSAAPYITSYKNNSNETFTQVTAFATLGNLGRSVAVGDLDNDGRVDVGGEPSNTSAVAGVVPRIYRSTNPVGMGFSSVWASSNSASEYSSVGSYFTDFNNDGYRDLAFGRGRLSLLTSSVYVTTTPATGFNLQLITVSTYTRMVTAGDLNGDGRPDLLMAVTAVTSGKSQVIAYLGGGWAPRDPPTPPTAGFQVKAHYGYLASGTTFTFYWGDGTDPIAGSTAGYVVAIATYPMTVAALGGAGTSTTTWPSRLTIPSGRFSISPNYGTPFQPMLMTRTTDQLNRLIVNLDHSATYYWRVATINTADKRSEWSAEQNTLSGPPSPTGLTIKAVYTSSISAHWVLTQMATGYTLAASTMSSGAPIWASSTTVGNGVTTATVFTPALNPNTTYYMFARTNQLNESSAYSAGVATATLAALPLSAVSTFSAVTGESFTVFWSSAGNPLVITTYTVQLSTASDFNVGASSVTLTTAPAAGVSAGFTGLEGLTRYYARVRAVNHNGTLTDFTTLGSTTTLIKTPGGLQIQAVFASSIRASWGLTAGATGYTLAASTNSANPPSPIWASSVTVGNAVTTATVSTPALDANTTYYLFARSNGPDVSSAYTAGLATATLANAPATAVSTFVYVNATSMTVTWSRNGNPIAITTYTVVLSPQTPYPNANALNVVLTTAPAGASPTTVVTGLDAAATYYLFVRAVNHNEVPTSYTALGSTLTTSTPKTWVGTGGNKNWHNPGNWSPAGVPAITDVVTIDLPESVAVSASSPTAVFASLTLGKANGSAASNVTFSTSARGGAVTIYKAAGLTQGTTSQLYFSRDFTMFSGSSLTHLSNGTGAAGVLVSSVNIRALGTFDLQAGATVQVSTMGFTGGANITIGNGPGRGGAGTIAIGGGGGGYGGAGGAGGPSGSTTGGPAYGNFTAPNAAGSGGGGGNPGLGGSGGGVVILDVGTMKLDGRIEAYGGRGVDGADTGAGGGSGGGVNITADYFSGAGAIDVHGGAGANDNVSAFDDSGGGGGGGRAAVTITNSGSVCGLTISIAGGSRGTVVAGAVDGVAGSSSTSGSLAVPVDFAGAAQSASSILWTWDLVVGATDYQVFSSTGGPMSLPLGAAASYITANLPANTTETFYVQARACGADTQVSINDSEPTLAAAPGTVVSTFTAVHLTSMTVAWTGNGNPVDITTYTVVLSTSASYPNMDEGNVSLTTAPAGSSLAATLTGLSGGTAYFLFISAINHAGLATTYTPLGSTTTQAGPAAFSVDIIELSYPFGSLALNVSTVTVTSMTVVNDGVSPATFRIRAATTTTNSPWTLSTDNTNGFNEAVIQAVFHSEASQPAHVQFGPEDVVTDFYQASQDTAGGGRYTIDDSQTGFSVPPGQSRALWLRFTTPLGTSTTDFQEVKLTILAM